MRLSETGNRYVLSFFKNQIRVLYVPEEVIERLCCTNQENDEDESYVLMQGCQCELAQLPGTEKGIDDWVVAGGKKLGYRKLFFPLPLRGFPRYHRKLKI
ncbi:hypothetical protein [Nostoc sp.]